MYLMIFNTFIILIESPPNIVYIRDMWMFAYLIIFAAYDTRAN